MCELLQSRSTLLWSALFPAGASTLDAGGQTPLDEGQVLASQPTLSRLIENLSNEPNRSVLRDAISEAAIRRVRMLNGGRRRKTLT